MTSFQCPCFTHMHGQSLLLYQNTDGALQYWAGQQENARGEKALNHKIVRAVPIYNDRIIPVVRLVAIGFKSCLPKMRETARKLTCCFSQDWLMTAHLDWNR